MKVEIEAYAIDPHDTDLDVPVEPGKQRIERP
jgi:hypothetical protein